jgi:hypothetical protein
MAITYEPIATTTLGSAQTGVTFSSIPGTYTDIVAVINASCSSDTSAWFNTNASAGSLFSVTRLTGDGSTASSARTTGQDESIYTNGSQVTTTFAFVATLHFMNYSNTTTFKTILSRSGNSGASTTAAVSLRRDTSAITTINFDLTGAATYSVGSTFTLYGIKAF